MELLEGAYYREATNDLIVLLIDSESGMWYIEFERNGNIYEFPFPQMYFYNEINNEKWGYVYLGDV